MKPRIRVRPMNEFNCHNLLSINGSSVGLHRTDIAKLSKDYTIVDYLRDSYDRQVKNNCLYLAKQTAGVLRLS